MVQNAVKRPAGRPRKFDEDAVLDSALRVFRSFGFEGSTVERLTKEMGLNKPSFYRAFGGRRELFERVAGLYAQRVTAIWRCSLQDSENIEDAVRHFFAAAVNSFAPTSTEESQGCLFLTAITSGAGNDIQVRNILFDFIAMSDIELAAELSEQFDIWFASSNCTPLTLAQVMNSGVHSIAIRARAGASKEELEKVSQNLHFIIFR